MVLGAVVSDGRRERNLNEKSEMRLRIARARARLEKLDAQMFFDERGNVGTDTHQSRLSANAVELAEAVRDALDILNAMPDGYWRKYPEEYNRLVKVKDLK